MLISAQKRATTITVIAIMRAFRVFNRIWRFKSFSVIGLALFCLAMYGLIIWNGNREYRRWDDTKSGVSLRKFPHPYRAALAICSDIDQTGTIEEFVEIQKFLNTSVTTTMGRGLGLDIGNSFLMYEPPSDSISYFEGDERTRRIIETFIKAGVIDVIHSYGKKKDFTREDAVRGLEALHKANCKVNVWVDHTRTLDNLGKGTTFGEGDRKESAAYHADLTLGYGIKFAWMGAGTMVVGQGVPVKIGSFAEIWDSEHPTVSAANVCKEWMKHFLGVVGVEAYSIRKRNDLVEVRELEDGQRLYEFVRFDDHWRGLSAGGNSRGLAHVISERNLKRLQDVGGYCIVYTHLGMNSDCEEYICEETKTALRKLAEQYHNGRIYVTTTSKLLNYYINSKYLEWTYTSSDGNDTVIVIHSIRDPVFGDKIPVSADLEGITFYVPNAGKSRVFIGNDEITEIQRNGVDFTNRESVSFPVKRLQFPAKREGFDE